MRLLLIALFLAGTGEPKVTASSTWDGWPARNAVDGNLETSWFSGQDDSAARKKSPWLELEFPRAIAVKGVEVLGNRDPEWEKGYTIHVGQVELFDASGKSLWKGTNEGWNKLQDMRFELRAKVEGVRRVRFTSVADEGAQNPYGDIAIAEMRVF
jgi:hypothetical protein